MKKKVQAILDNMSIPDKQRFLARSDSDWIEYPVDIETFIDSEDYLNASEYVWPANRNDLIELFNGDYDEAVFNEAIGSGKSFTSSIILTYIVYKLQCLRDPQKFFRLAPGSNIAIINMSKSGQQAKKVVFGEVTSRIEGSTWFQKYALPDQKVKSELKFPKNITIFPGNSKSTFPLGFNIFAAVMDEAAWYMETGTKDAAEDMYNVLQRRIKSRFIRKSEFHGLLVMISNPRYTGDFIERKYKESIDNPKMFGVKRAVWEAKPAWFWSGETFEIDGVQIPIELQKDFEKDRGKAWRDHGARPSLTLEPYFREFYRVLKCVGKRKHPINPDGRYNKAFRGKGRYKYRIHIDLGYKRDACGIVMGHKEENEKIKIDLMLQLKPSRGNEIQLSDVRGRVYEISRLGFPISSVSYDGFQSVESRQELEKEGFKVKLVSVDRTLEPYDTLKDMIYEEKVDLYEYEPALDELEKLELVKGKKVDHSPFSSKDVADALAAVVWLCSSDRIYTGDSFGISEMEDAGSGFEDVAPDRHSNSIFR